MSNSFTGREAKKAQRYELVAWLSNPGHIRYCYLFLAKKSLLKHCGLYNFCIDIAFYSYYNMVEPNKRREEKNGVDF
jgi:hypothetical protein